jgi:hypothetical protein
LRCDISKILSVATAQAPPPPKPHSGGIASGAGSETRPKGPHQHDDTDALFAVEVQSFLQGDIGFLLRRIFAVKIPGFGSSKPVHDIAREPYRRFESLSLRQRLLIYVFSGPAE